MAINNPYIPGDPYSYDLKWLVAKVKEILAQLGTLDEAIEAKIFEGFLEHSIVQFKTVPEMLAADITDGSIVLTLGYHEAGDMGGLFYLVKDFNPSQCALDYFLTLDNNNQIAIPVIVTDYVTPEMFGAKRDGSTDDLQALQLAADVGHEQHKEVLLSSGIYLISDTLTLTGGNDNTMYGLTVRGNNKGETTIKAASAMTNVVTVTSEGSSIANIYLDSFIIDADSKATTCLYWAKAAANNGIYNLKLNKCTGWAYNTAGDHYLNTIEKVRVDNCNGGFKIDSGTNTSLRLVDCFVQSATNAYQIEGVYCNLINCCADNISNIVFRIPHFTGTLIGCGTEAFNAEVVFSGGLGTTVTIVNPITWYLQKATGIQVQAGAGSRFNIVGGYLGYSPSNQVSPGKLYQTALDADVNFMNVTFGKYTLTNTFADITSRASFDVIGGSVKSRYNEKIAYIGMDTQQTGGVVDPKGPSTMRANAIYFGLGDSRAALVDGTSLQYNAYAMKGDILLSQKPAEIGAAGWIQCEDVSGVSGANWISGTFKKIPVVMAGTTAQRPTYYTADAGMMYFDTTLNKPIWWTGGSWRDATGANV